MFRSIHTKIVAAFIAVIAVTAVVVFTASFFQIRQHEHELLDSLGLAAARECANELEIAYDEGSGGDFIPGSRDYDICREHLRDLCEMNGVNYLYVCKYDVENDTITYIMAVGASDEENEVISRERPYGAVAQGGIDDIEKRALAGEEVEQALEIDNQFGHMLDWFYPVEEMGGDVLAGASYSVSKQRERVMSRVLNNLLPFVIAFLALFVVEVIILRKSVFKPLQTIADHMRGFSAESPDALEPLNITSKDEIGDIAEAFEGMAGDIGEYTSRIEHLAAERAQADYELNMSRRIQQGMVPERTETAGAGFSACGFSRPARSVGGDFYDVLQLEDGRIAVVVGDASGKGMAAALFMSVMKTIIRDGLLSGFGPAYVLSHANERIASSNPEGMFVTVFACVFDPTTGEVRYANAGHMPPLLVDAGMRVLEVDPGELLGLFDDAVIEEASIILKPGQGLLVYTDGAVEARSADGSFFGERRFADAMGAHAPYADAGALVDTAVRVVDEFVEEREQFDDLTVAALRFEGASGLKAHGEKAATSLELPCEMASFSKVREALFATGTDNDLKMKACLACEEAFANIVSYSDATRIWVRVWESGGRLHVELADDGAAFDPLAANSADKDFEDLDSGGMGIGLIRQLASHLEYRREGDCNILTIVVA